MVGQEPAIRIRQKHSRSRAGCLTCRRRHVRCDEERPNCSKCVKTGLLCDYAPVGAPLKSHATKTKLPGVEAPWQIISQVSAEVDPFDALPIRMPYNSTNLLSFFMQTNTVVGDVVRHGVWKSHLSFGNANAVFCRSTMLMASAFFAGRAGGLQSFEPAYLHHKLEAIREINQWLYEPVARIADCLKLIGALSLIEGYFGNDNAAVQHLAGLSKLLDFKGDCQETANMAFVDDKYGALIERYNLLSQGIDHHLQALNNNTVIPTPGSPPPYEAAAPNHDTYLEAIRLIPYFFSFPTIDANATVGGEPVMEELRHLTSLMDGLGNFDDTHTKNVAVIILQSNKLQCRSMFRLQEDAAQRSISPRLPIKYRSLAAARYCYVYGVLGLRKAGSEAHRGLLPHLTTLLVDDADADARAAIPILFNTDLWIWKVLVATVSLYKFQFELRVLYSDLEIELLQTLAKKHIDSWQKRSRIKDWCHVEEILARFVWPRRGNSTANEIFDAVYAQSGDINGLFERATQSIEI